MINYNALGNTELVRLAQALEEELIKAYEELGCDRSDAQGVVEAIIIKNT